MGLWLARPPVKLGRDMSSVEELLQHSLAELAERFLTQGRPVPAGLVEALQADPRRGAQVLARRLLARRGKGRSESRRLRDMLRYEQVLWKEGVERVAGVDEAGRGPLAGPVVAAAVILPPGCRLEGVDDSKKILDEGRREELAESIRGAAVAWAVGQAEVEEIDALNIRRASLLAMRRAVEALRPAPQHLLLDAFEIPDLALPQRGIIKGDSLSLSIAAASLLAKTARDRLMRELDRQYPGYGLAGHKGYPTAEHLRALQELGVSPIHRRSFGPVRQVLGAAPVQADLFTYRSRAS